VQIVEWDWRLGDRRLQRPVLIEIARLPIALATDNCIAKVHWPRQSSITNPLNRQSPIANSTRQSALGNLQW
jgi:hypothetical protein